MHKALITLINRLASPAIAGTDVIPWGCPVPSFGDLNSSQIATLGLNPSNREFVDKIGTELKGISRRFHTLNSLGLDSWADADARHLGMIIDSCRAYFEGNPYDRWFGILNQVISGTKASYYSSSNSACHLDLIPYATARKWTELNSQQRSSLLTISSGILGLLLRDSPVRILILNGRSVVKEFQNIAEVCLDVLEMPAWSLPRNSNSDVTGIAYKGKVDVLAGIALEQEILVLGYNHNLQSSFGVTKDVINSIRLWIAHVVEEVL